MVTRYCLVSRLVPSLSVMVDSVVCTVVFGLMLISTKLMVTLNATYIYYHKPPSDSDSND